MVRPKRCDKTELLVTECAHCLGQTADWDKLEEELDSGASTKRAPTIESNFPSRCPGCGERIQTGDMIRLLNIGWCCSKHWS